MLVAKENPVSEALEIVEPRGALIDYAMINAEQPDLYARIPSLQTLAGLRVGQFVKIGLRALFLDQSSGLHPEHFWIEIVERRGEQGFVGRVENDIQDGFRVKYRDALVFCAHHIIEIKDEA